MDDDKTLELKKIALKKEESLKDGMCTLGIYKKSEEKLVLDTNHKYY